MTLLGKSVLVLLVVLLVGCANDLQRPVMVNLPVQGPAAHRAAMSQEQAWDVSRPTSSGFQVITTHVVAYYPPNASITKAGAYLIVRYPLNEIVYTLSAVKRVTQIANGRQSSFAIPNNAGGGNPFGGGGNGGGGSGGCDASVPDCGVCPDCTTPYARPGGTLDCALQDGACGYDPITGVQYGIFRMWPQQLLDFFCDFNFSDDSLSCFAQNGKPGPSGKNLATDLYISPSDRLVFVSNIPMTQFGVDALAFVTLNYPDGPTSGAKIFFVPQVCANFYFTWPDGIPDSAWANTYFAVGVPINKSYVGFASKAGAIYELYEPSGECSG